ncbi:MAG: hypothetical protein CMH26_05055 [Micavibrio sp.]|nr:hypothetical protein [Micavibrio sp.]
MGKKYIISGAGFRGFCDALELLKNPENEVHIIESAPFFGGIAYSREVKGFYVDKGVHVFDSIPKDLGEIVNEIMDGQTKEIEFVSASAFNGQVTEGFSLPDLSSLNESTKEQIKRELLQIAKEGSKEDQAQNLKEVFYTKFGDTAGAIFSQIFEKTYSISPEEIEPSGMSVTSLHRLKFLDDAEMVELKKDPWLDTVLAARRKSMAPLDDLVSLYPSDGKAMKGWCDRAVPWLEKKGAKISLGEKIISIKDKDNSVEVHTDKGTYEVDQVIWANDNIEGLASALGFEFDIKSYQYGTPMLFATMITDVDKIKDFTYVQNFNLERLTFRSASAGLYSGQVNEQGHSFITCECPAVIGSEDWEKPESIIDDLWKEMKDLGVVASNAELHDYEIVRIPSTFKPPKIGYQERVDEFYEELPKYSSRVLLRDVRPFFRRTIYNESLKLTELLDEENNDTRLQAALG